MLPTPEANERNAAPRWTKTRANGQRLEPNLAGVVALLPTPTSSTGGPEPEGKTGRKLTTVVGMLPTPSTRDYKGANGPEHMKKDRQHMCQLPNAITHGTNHGLKLHPAFALWMMGYPEDWLDLKDGE